MSHMIHLMYGGQPELFQLDPEVKPTAVAGVPPDGFSADGQLLG